MNTMSSEAAGSSDDQGGPMWGRFFDSLGGEDTESHISGSHFPGDTSFASPSGHSHFMQSPFPEVHPNDSASAVGDEGSVLDGYPKDKETGPAPQLIGDTKEIAPPVDDGTYVFKFRTPSGRTHRFQARDDNLEHLREIVGGKLSTDPFFTSSHPNPETGEPLDPYDFLLSYTDADGDVVLMSADDDVADAVKNARVTGADRVVLFIQGGRGWEDTPKSKPKAEVVAPPQEELREIERADSVQPEKAESIPPPPVYIRTPPPPEPELVMGIPKDLLLPASIGALAVVIIGVFTISRMSSR